MLTAAAVRRPSSPELLDSSSAGVSVKWKKCVPPICYCHNPVGSALAVSRVGVFDVFNVCSYAHREDCPALPVYCMNSEKWIELLWHSCGRVLREEMAESEAMPQHGLRCSDRERKGQDKKRVHRAKKKTPADMKEAREQERQTLTKDGKARSRDPCLIRETEPNERLRHPCHPLTQLFSLHSLAFICRVNKGSVSPASIPNTLWLIARKW